MKGVLTNVAAVILLVLIKVSTAQPPVSYFHEIYSYPVRKKGKNLIPELSVLLTFKENSLFGPNRPLAIQCRQIEIRL